MKNNWRVFLGLLVLLALLPASLLALNVVYTNNDLTAANGGNSVSAYQVFTGGTLGLIGSYSTGGAGTGGGLYAASRIIVVGNFLYASNAGSNNVAAFAINSATGALTAVPGSPFATGAYNSSSESGISLAATPDGKYLYAGSTALGGQITIYQIDSTSGALTADPTLVAVDGPVTSMKVSPGGGYLVVAILDLDELETFSIGTNGSLARASALTESGMSFTGVDINCAGDHVYAGIAGSNTVEVFNLDSSNGTLSLNSVSPAASVSSSQVVLLSPDDNTLFVSNQGSHTVTPYNVASDGSLTLASSPQGTGNSYAYPGGLAINGDGTFLFAASAIPAVSVYGVGGSTPLVLDNYYPTGLSYGLLSVAAYPPKVCAASPSNLTGTLQISDGPPPSYSLNVTASLGAGTDPLMQPVTLQIGSYAATIPVGSFKTYQNGTNAGLYVFQGVIDSVTLKVQIAALGANQFQISAYGKQVDTSTLTNPVTVTIGASSASAKVTITTDNLLRGLWRAQ